MKTFRINKKCYCFKIFKEISKILLKILGFRKFLIKLKTKFKKICIYSKLYS